LLAVQQKRLLNQISHAQSNVFLINKNILLTWI
jgi:hypothetical protein